jgi:hypothetical protein
VGGRVELHEGVERILRDAARNIKSGYVDPQEVRNLAMVLLSAALLSGEDFYYVLSNALYTLADALGAFLRVTSMPLSIEVRGRAEKMLEEVRLEVSGSLSTMAAAVASNNQCEAMRSASELLRVSYKVNSLAENFKNILMTAEVEEV